MKFQLHFALMVILITLIALTACSSGGRDVNIAIAVALTQTAAAIGQPANTPLPPPPASPTPMPSTPPPPPSTSTPGPTNTPGATGCANNVKFIADVTIPDKTVVAPGAAFTKIWRVKNDGTCTWNNSYYLAFTGGNQMSGPGVVPIAGNVAPGSEYNVSVNLVAPMTSGEHRGQWQFVDGSGAVFGRVYVLIVVPSTPTLTPLPTSTPSAKIDLWADYTSLRPGECAVISWEVENVKAVFFEGNGVPGSGSEKVCLEQTKVYELRVEKLDGSIETRQIKIEVTGGTPTPPSIRQQGSVTLRAVVDNPAPDAYLNLDNGARGDATDGDLSGTDIRVILSGGSQTFYILEPVNGAVAKIMGVTEPGYSGCKGAEGSFSSGNIPEVVVGNYICVKTGKGRHSQVRIETVEAIVSGVGTVRLGFITWE